MTQFRERLQSGGLRKLSLASPTSSWPSMIMHPEMCLLVVDQWHRREGLGKTNRRSLTTADVVRAFQILKERQPHLPARHGMSSYASCMAQSKPAGNRHSTSPQRGYRSRVRRCLCYQGRPPDPRISPEQEIGEKNSRHNDNPLLLTHQTPSFSLLA